MDMKLLSFLLATRVIFAAAAIRNVKAEGINPAHYDMRFVKPIDKELLHEVFGKFNKIITVEDGTIIGGFGSAVLEFMNEHGYKADVKIMGIPDRLVEHGSPKELYREIGMDAEAITDALRENGKCESRKNHFDSIINCTLIFDLLVLRKIEINSAAA
jgi:1-deoxy-D-xylulose-5-phosphate synthase